MPLHLFSIMASMASLWPLNGLSMASQWPLSGLSMASQWHCLVKILSHDFTLQPVNFLEHIKSTRGEDPGFEVLLASTKQLKNIAGYEISRGCLGCGRIPSYASDESYLMDMLRSKRRDGGVLRVIALDKVSDCSNLGSIIRCASAFEFDAIVLSDDCCDQWYRRTIRVSMGHIFRVPVIRVTSLIDTLTTIKRELGVSSHAAVVDDSSCFLDELTAQDLNISPDGGGGGYCVVLGNEGEGIRPEVSEVCDKKVKIRMASEVDSLSVVVATGIILYAVREIETKARGR